MRVKLKITVMRLVQEITIENVGDLKNIIRGVVSEAEEKKAYINESFALIGEETIKKAADMMGIVIGYGWKAADEEIRHLKIKGTATFVYVALVEVCHDASMPNTKGYVDIRNIEKVISYKGHLLSVHTAIRDRKTYAFYLFNEKSYRQHIKTEKPNKVGTLTDKKADAWLSALLDESIKRNDEQDAVDGRKAAFMIKMSKFTGFPESTFEKNGTIHSGMFIISWRYYNNGEADTDLKLDPVYRNKKGYIMSNDEKLAIFAKCGLLG